MTSALPLQGAKHRRQWVGFGFVRGRLLTSTPRKLLIGATTLLLLTVAGVAALRGNAAGQPATPADPSTIAELRLTARGVLAPVGQARVATLQGGVVQRIPVEVGQEVGERAEVARVLGPDGVEVLTAPWHGTITGVLVHSGDTVMPGTVVVNLGDLSRLQVETTDVDEFLIPSISKGQTVQVMFDALEGKRFAGTVRSVAPQPQTGPTGDTHYPVIVDLAGTVPEMRAGMTARLDFGGRPR